MIDAYCANCSFLSAGGSYLTCDYILVTGHMRGCTTGTGCDRKIPGARKVSIAFCIYAGREPKLLEDKKPRVDRKSMTRDEVLALERERKKQEVQMSRERLNGKQREVLLEFKDRTKMSNRAIADAIGVYEGSVAKWMTECRAANWEKLAVLGIQKPDGL